jgi:hypothetical protein
MCSLCRREVGGVLLEEAIVVRSCQFNVIVVSFAFMYLHDALTDNRKVYAGFLRLRHDLLFREIANLQN